MSNFKHYPTHPGAEQPPTMCMEIPVEEYEAIKRENAQLKKEIEFMHSNCKWNAGDGCARLLGEKLAIINENVEIKRENRRLKRALWLARADRALSEQYVISNAVLYLENKFNHKFNSVRHELHVWGVVKRKCRAKAKEYK